MRAGTIGRLRPSCKGGSSRSDGGWLAAVVLTVSLTGIAGLAGGCGGGATTVELAEPLSPEETERMIGGIRSAWSEGGEPRPSDPEGTDAGAVEPMQP